MAKQQGSVFERLYDTRSYTGVYAERFKGADGRINSHTDLSARSPGSGFTGNTNTGTNEVIHDISQIMRPNLRMTSSHGPSGVAMSSREETRRINSPARNGQSAQQRRFSVSAGMWYDVDSERPVNATYVEPSPKGLDTAEQLRHIFRYYCAYGRTGAKGASEDTIDSLNFMKFARDCPNLLTKKTNSLNRTEVDLIFTKAKQKFERRLDFTHFLDALSAMAAKRYPEYDPTTAFSVLLAHHVFKLECAPQQLRNNMSEHAKLQQGGQSPQKNQRTAAPAAESLYDKHEQQYARSMNNQAAHQNMMGMSPTERRMASEAKRPRTSQNYGTPRRDAEKFGPNNATIAGSANKPGSVYARLCEKGTFTGVYRRRFEGDGRINAHTDLTASATQFKGNTNTRTNEKFHSIKGMLRTNLSSGGSRMMRF